MEYYLDKNSGTFITLPRMYRVAGKPLYAFISCVLFAVSAMLTLAVAGQLKGAADILHMVVYVIAVICMACGNTCKESQCNDFNNTGASYSVSYIMSGIH